MKVVFDTSVIVAGVRSRQGASFALLNAIPSSKFQICLSVALYLEWQAVLTRREHLPPGMTAHDALRYLRFLASHARHQHVHFRWRPFLNDPDDDMILELAIAGGCHYIVTHNIQDFRRAADLGVMVAAPGEFLRLIAKN